MTSEAAPDEKPECTDSTCAACESRRLVQLLDLMSYRDTLRVYVQALLARSPIRCAR
jgi:hypothetical protein